MSCKVITGADRHRRREFEKKLIILLDEYPFEPGEYSFIRIELEKLLECFEVCILSVSASTEQKMITDERISVYHCMRTFGIRKNWKRF